MLGIDDRRSHGILEFQPVWRQLPLAHRLDVKAKKRRCAAVENVERGAGARVDLEQKSLSVPHHEIGGGEPLDLEGPGYPHDGGCHAPRTRGGKSGRTHRSAIAPQALRGRRRPLLAEAEHARAAAIADEQRRNGASLDALLIVGIGGGLHEPARDDVAAAGAASLLGEPAGALGGTLACRQGMRNSKAVEFGEENLRRLEALHRGGVIAEQGPAFGDQRQKLGAILEAGAIDEAEKGGRRKPCQRLESAEEGLPPQSLVQAAGKLAAGMRRILRIGIGEEIGDQRREARAKRRLRERPARDRCDEQRGPSASDEGAS